MLYWQLSEYFTASNRQNFPKVFNSFGPGVIFQPNTQLTRIQSVNWRIQAIAIQANDSSVQPSGVAVELGQLFRDNIIPFVVANRSMPRWRWWSHCGKVLGQLQSPVYVVAGSSYGVYIQHTL